MSSHLGLAIDYEEIDPRFVESVRWLRLLGYYTNFAGFIGAIPTIRMKIEPGLVLSDTRIIYCRLRDLGLNVDPKHSNRIAVEGLYDPATRHGTISVYNMLDSIFLPFLHGSQTKQED